MYIQSRMMERLLKVDNDCELIAAGRNNAKATRLADMLDDVEVSDDSFGDNLQC